MTREAAKQILLLHRPWLDTPPDTETAEALAMLEQDAALRAWFEQHCQWQRAVRNSVRAVSPPEAFREQIVSECQARRRSMSRRKLLAAATTILLIGVGIEAYLLFGDRIAPEEVTFAAYERRMGRDALRLYRMDLETNNLTTIREFLATRQSPANYELPPGLSAVKATGCVATKWQGRPVSMICFNTGKPLQPNQSSDLFLFVMAEDHLPDAPKSQIPTFAKVNQLNVARWSAGGNTYLLATEHALEELQKNL